MTQYLCQSSHLSMKGCVGKAWKHIHSGLQNQCTVCVKGTESVLFDNFLLTDLGVLGYHNLK
jgi:hypothetical protein